MDIIHQKNKNLDSMSTALLLTKTITLLENTLENYRKNYRASVKINNTTEQNIANYVKKLKEKLEYYKDSQISSEKQDGKHLGENLKESILYLNELVDKYYKVYSTCFVKNLEDKNNNKPRNDAKTLEYLLDYTNNN